MTRIQVQNWRKCDSYVPYIHTSHTKQPYIIETIVDKNLKNNL